MLTLEQTVEIKVLYRQNRSIRSIARELGVSRNTVRRHLREGTKATEYGPRSPRVGKLDAFKSYLLERINAAKPDWIPSTVLFREIKEQGYTGGMTLLKVFLSNHRPKKEPEPLIRFETEPGQQMQADFMTVKRDGVTIKVFVATLGFSRAGFAWFCKRERQEDWIKGLQLAFEYFGGVPKEVLFDNAKCIMVERNAYGQGNHKWNATLLAFAKDYGFIPKACRPYRAKTKGKVERLNRYLKSSFIIPLATSLKQVGLLPDIEIFNGKIGPWLEEVAHQRIHGTTGQTPQELLDKERSSLIRLPQVKYTTTLPSKPTHVVIPLESIQHPLSVYDSLLEVAL